MSCNLSSRNWRNKSTAIQNFSNQKHYQAHYEKLISIMQSPRKNNPTSINSLKRPISTCRSIGRNNIYLQNNIYSSDATKQIFQKSEFARCVFPKDNYFHVIKSKSNPKKLLNKVLKHQFNQYDKEKEQIKKINKNGDLLNVMIVVRFLSNKQFCKNSFYVIQIIPYGLRSPVLSYQQLIKDAIGFKFKHNTHSNDYLVKILEIRGNNQYCIAKGKQNSQFNPKFQIDIQTKITKKFKKSTRKTLQPDFCQQKQNLTQTTQHTNSPTNNYILQTSQNQSSSKCFIRSPRNNITSKIHKTRNSLPSPIVSERPSFRDSFRPNTTEQKPSIDHKIDQKLCCKSFKCLPEENLMKKNLKEQQYQHIQISSTSIAHFNQNHLKKKPIKSKLTHTLRKTNNNKGGFLKDSFLLNQPILEQKFECSEMIQEPPSFSIQRENTFKNEKEQKVIKLQDFEFSDQQENDDDVEIL